MRSAVGRRVWARLKGTDRVVRVATRQIGASAPSVIGSAVSVTPLTASDAAQIGAVEIAGSSRRTFGAPLRV